ncbi:MAG: peptide chain release factor 2 [Deltaproteobacteria bacterium]|nr:peptide chain release factor 2 [Deltaproteobacteria bacterium]
MFDVDGKISRLAELEKECGQSDFWKNSEQAEKLLRQRKSLQNAIEAWERQFRTLEDNQVLFGLAQEENDEATALEVEKDLEKIEKEISGLELQRMLQGEEDHHDAIVVIHSGAGGTEAQDWASMLFRMYLRWAEKSEYRTEIIDMLPGEEAGIKSVTFIVGGKYAYGFLKAEIGIHRLVRISPFDAGRRRHTSFSSVFVYPDIEDEITIEINESDLRIDTYRSSGAGGQHVNKTDSAVRITHIPTGIVVQCQNERSQHKNKASAMKILKARLYESQMQEKNQKKEEVHASKKEIAWGSQIRSYILQPYRMVKDHRTGKDVGNVDAVLDGDIDGFIQAYLLSQGPKAA